MRVASNTIQILECRHFDIIKCCLISKHNVQKAHLHLLLFNVFKGARAQTIGLKSTYLKT